VHEVLGRIVKDEAAHGQLGWFFLDWAEERLDQKGRTHLARVARETIEAIRSRWSSIPSHGDDDGDSLGWMESQSYVDLARRALESHVLAPLRERGIDPMAVEAPPQTAPAFS
jgi:hypothetical protein